MLLYGCENWAYGGLKQLEKFHTDFLKRILHVKQSTLHVMLYGDLGRYPVSIAIKKRTIGFWFNLVSNENMLSSTLYKLMYNDHLKNNKWLNNVKSIFDECGLSFIWRAQRVYGSKELLCNRIEMSLKYQFKQTWHSAVTESP